MASPQSPHSVEIFTGEGNCLGIGSYGAVYKAKRDGLLCAAKILHQTFFQTNDASTNQITSRFQQECALLGALQHPNIVQYLGTYKDRQSGFIVLLTELLDENLTSYLHRCIYLLPYCLQVDICHDITLAIAYLHSQHIIHRDLSSNNVLMMAGKRAKVSDFGMSKLMRENSTPYHLTHCPGTEVYMPPEALKIPPAYSNKIDCFSLGPLILQVLTRLFPNPGPRTEQRAFHASPTGSIEMPITETERRRNHISLVETSNPLLAIAMACLHHNPQQRPPAAYFCAQFEEIKRERKYEDSKSRFLTLDTATLTVMNTAHSVEESGFLQECIVMQDHKLQELHSDKRKLSEELVTLKGEIKEQTLLVSQLQRKLKENEEVVADFQQTLERKNTAYTELQRQIKLTERLSLQVLVQRKCPFKKSSEIIKFKWTQRSPLPVKLTASSCTHKDDVFYILDSKTQKLHAYKRTSQEWSLETPDCPLHDTTLECINSILTAVGGKEDRECTNKLVSFLGEGSTKRWVRYYPPMLSPRTHPVTVSTPNQLIVAGGIATHSIPSDAVEVLNIATKQWIQVNPLPSPITRGSAAIAHNVLYIAAMQGETSELNKTAVACPMRDLSMTGEAELLWYSIADLPAYYSTLVSAYGHLLAIGGKDAKKRVSEVYVYNVCKDEWKVAGHMTTPRSSCIALIADGSELTVLGGSTDEGPTDNVEAAEVTLEYMSTGCIRT